MAGKKAGFFLIHYESATKPECQLLFLARKKHVDRLSFARESVLSGEFDGYQNKASWWLDTPKPVGSPFGEHNCQCSLGGSYLYKWCLCCHLSSLKKMCRSNWESYH